MKDANVSIEDCQRSASSSCHAICQVTRTRTNTGSIDNVFQI